MSKRKKIDKNLSTIDETLAVQSEKQVVAAQVVTDVKTVSKLLENADTVILNTDDLKKHKVPSASKCLEFGYILTYLMPNCWLLTTVTHIQKLQEATKNARS